MLGPGPCGRRAGFARRQARYEEATRLHAAGVSLSRIAVAAGLRRDVVALQAALDLPWTTNPAEGQINRITTIKRTMYGRAGFQLFRARVLNTA